MTVLLNAVTVKWCNMLLNRHRLQRHLLTAFVAQYRKSIDGSKIQCAKV